jgi:hypothetical protein
MQDKDRIADTEDWNAVEAGHWEFDRPKHSPGRWLWAESMNHVLTIWSGQQLVAVKENATEEDKANFILMRASPELLGELEVLAAFLRTLDLLAVDGEAERRAYIARIDSLIAAASGQKAGAK